MRQVAIAQVVAASIATSSGLYTGCIVFLRTDHRSGVTLAISYDLLALTSDGVLGANFTDMDQWSASKMNWRRDESASLGPPL